MNITNTITLDLFRASLPPTIYAKQGDKGSRKVEATLAQNGTSYTIPEGATAIVRIGKPDGTGCYYDADSISGAVVTFTLAEQALAAAGEAHGEVNLYTADGERLTAFAFRLLIEKSVLSDATIVSSDYFNALTATVAQILQAGTGIKIIDYYATLEALNAAITDPTPGDIYGVGQEGAYDYYGWSGAANDWVELGTIEGAPGDNGVSPSATITPTNSGATISITDATGTTTAELTNGTDGEAGTGNNWYSGTAITGTSTTPASFATGIEAAQQGDLYLNTSTGYVYKCASVGDAATATWVYLINITGAPGTDGDDGRGIVSIARTSGTGMAGSIDTYTITYTDDTTSALTVYNGTDGTGVGDMTKVVYDTNNDGVVDDAAKLGGHFPAYYAAATEIPDVPDWAMAADKPTYTAAEVGAIATTAKGAASGVAELDGSGRVPSAQLPSYVDDVVEYTTAGDFPATGEAGKIYIATATNITYRWSGSAYVEISSSLALGETSATAYRGDRGKTAYDHSQATGNPHSTTAADVGAQTPPTIATALPTSGNNLAPNTIYISGGTLTSYEFCAPSIADGVGWAHGWFSTSADFTSITFANGPRFLGSVPAFAASKSYEFDVARNDWAFVELVSE